MVIIESRCFILDEKYGFTCNIKGATTFSEIRLSMSDQLRYPSFFFHFFATYQKRSAKIAPLHRELSAMLVRYLNDRFSNNVRKKKVQ
jgi:hypothetical protein